MNHINMKNNQSADEARQKGNENYIQRRYFDALIDFNESLCYAQPGSTTMGYAYANRALVYLELKLFLNCLNNVQLARDNGYPMEKIDKLDQREAKCKQLMESEEHPKQKCPWDFFKLSYDAHTNIPFLANCLEMKEDEKFGARIVTNRNLKAGDIIAIVDGALNFIDPMARLHRCFWCAGESLLDMIPCLGCPMAMFCSKRCLAKGQFDYHYEYCDYCPIPNVDNQHLLENYFRERVLAHVKMMFSEDPLDWWDFLDSKDKGKPWNFFDFDWNKMDKETFDKHLLLVLLAKHKYLNYICLGREITFKVCMAAAARNMLPMTLVLSVFVSKPDEISKFAPRGNEMHYESIMSNFIGCSMNPIKCFLSISCAPNASLISVDNKMVLMVMRPIETGEKITVSNGKEFYDYDKQARQQFNQMIFNIPCECIACVEDWPKVVALVYKMDPSTDQEEAMNRFQTRTKMVQSKMRDPKTGNFLWHFIDLFKLDAKILAKPASFYP